MAWWPRVRIGRRHHDDDVTTAIGAELIFGRECLLDDDD